MPTDQYHEKFLKYLRAPEAEKIISGVADAVRVQANRRSVGSFQLPETLVPTGDFQIPVSKITTAKGVKNMRFKKPELAHPLIFKQPKGDFGVNWHAFDDHVEINKNVILLAEKTFTLTCRTVGQLSLLIVGDQEF